MIKQLNVFFHIRIFKKILILAHAKLKKTCEYLHLRIFGPSLDFNNEDER